MAKQKINRVELHKMLKAGKSQKECAAYFGVSEVAIWKAKKELNLSVVKNVTMEAGHRVVESHLDTVSQLQSINGKSTLIINGLMEEISKGGDAQEMRKLKELVFKGCQEVRGQLALQLDVFKTLYDVTAIAGFQKEVIEVVGNACKCHECGEEIFCGNCFVKGLLVSLDSFDEEIRGRIAAIVKSVPKAVIDLRAKIIDAMKRAKALRSEVTFKP